MSNHTHAPTSSSSNLCQCGKRIYRTQTEAVMALAECQSRKGRYETRYYLCHHTLSYHLTSQVKATQREARRAEASPKGDSSKRTA